MCPTNSPEISPHNSPESDSQKSTDTNPINNLETTLSLVILNSQSVINKKASLAVFLKNHDPDILHFIIYETWLSPNILSAEIFPPHYNVTRKDRTDGHSGVFIAYRNTLTWYELNYVGDSSVELVACRFTPQQQSLIVCSIYRPPNRNYEYMENLCQILQNICLTNSEIPIWIAGDVNLPNVNWESFCAVNNAYPINLCENFTEFAL